MIPVRTLEHLQFSQVLQQVSGYCHGLRAAERCREILPSNDAAAIHAELTRVHELQRLFAGSGYFPGMEYEDIAAEVKVLAIEGAELESDRIFAVKQSASRANSLLRFLRSQNEACPQLSQYCAVVPYNDAPVKAIEQVLDEQAQIRDQASAELSTIRRQIREKRRESERLFQQVMAKCRNEELLREQEQGFVNGRRTLAVKSEYKSRVNGFLHSKSESGRTVFIEPASTVEVNNDVAGLEADELRESRRIIRELCKALHPHAAWLSDAFSVLQYLDVAQAKARYAISIRACLPEINKASKLSLQKARHPILFLQNQRLGKATIPLSLDLDATTRVMLISGPNAGGKSIALKTAGLLQLMLQSGLLVPVAENSSMCFFEHILIDMGDTQSIENELSTYSARLKAMTDILELANSESLVLIDEFGSGTDPELGSAIAEAVLESLVNSACKAIITTHYGQVKLLAEGLPGAINASMLFDLEKMEPKYILSSGKPGSSYTFEVAERVGFPKYLIERAKTRLNKDKVKLNKLLAEVQDQKAKLEEELQRQEHEGFLLKMAREKYLELFNRWQEKQEEEKEQQALMKQQAYYGQKYLKLLQEWKDKKSRKEVIKRFIDGLTAESYKEEHLKQSGELERRARKKAEQIKSKLKVGSRVRVMNGKEIGVVEEIRDDKAVLTFGALRLTAGLENLILV